ncbi:MAG: radical SAM protein [Deltaproteobacteria bacterium]|nr:radical SAM protein [Deltaproteobacteria bacterium]
MRQTSAGPRAVRGTWLRRLLGGLGVRVRFESFGGIVALERPPLLAFVDQAFLRRLGFREHPRWGEARSTLSAPTEVHMTLTRACPVGCRGCYVDAAEPAPGELSTAAACAVLDDLAAAGVLHVAMGGGESYVRPDLFDIASHARQLGMVPNVTTSGLGMTQDLARRSRVFGQVNVSVDGLAGWDDSAGRPRGSWEVAERALELLRRARVRTGVNCVVTRQNVERLDELARAVRRLGVREVEFLRIKPTGRGTTDYGRRVLTREQARGVYPRILALARSARIRPRIDCSFLPMACHHAPDLGRMKLLGMLGCEAGHHLASVDSVGRVHACSFLEDGRTLPRGLAAEWDAADALVDYRHYRDRAPEPCASCAYLSICGGGCRAVSRFLTGDPFRPDPECPRVEDWSAARAQGSRAVAGSGPLLGDPPDQCAEAGDPVVPPHHGRQPGEPRASDSGDTEPGEIVV